MADREGFEPSIRLPVCQFSRLVPSTTRSPVRMNREGVVSSGLFSISSGTLAYDWAPVRSIGGGI